MNNNDLHAQTLQQLIASEFFHLIDGDSNHLLQVSVPTRSLKMATKSSITAFLGNPNGRMATWYTSLARVEFRPDIGRYKFFGSDGMTTINSYLPPKHLEDTFWDNLSPFDTEQAALTSTVPKTNKKPETWSALPDCYLDFFSHLCDNDFAACEYLMDWLSIAVDPTKRNLTTLVMIAKPGVGKGVFYETVLAPLFGKANGVLVRGQDSLKSRFNYSFANKRLIFFDEVQLRDIEALNRFKAFANSELEIEQKGKDTKYVKNWANTVIAANELDSILIEADDRRFSILQVTNERLDKMCAGSRYETVGKLRAELEDTNNIKKLYEWLITHEPNRNMNYPYIASVRTEEIKTASLYDWEQIALEVCTKYYNKGVKDILLDDVQKEISSINNYNGRIGRIKFKSLFERFPHIGSVHWDLKKRKVFIRVHNPFNNDAGLTKSEFNGTINESGAKVLSLTKAP